MDNILINFAIGGANSTSDVDVFHTDNINNFETDLFKQASFLQMYLYI